MTISRSAPNTRFLAVAQSLSGLGSLRVGSSTTHASLTSSVPGGIAESTRAQMSNCHVSPGCSVPLVQVRVCSPLGPVSVTSQLSVSISYSTSDGNVSVTVTFCASDGPLLWTEMVYLICSLAFTLAGSLDFCISRSAVVSTVTVASSVLFAELGSGVSVSKTSAVLVITVEAGTSDLMCTLTNTRMGTPSVGGMSPSGQKRTLLPTGTSQANGTPPVPPSTSTKALRNSTSSGRESRSVTSRDTDGPRLLMSCS